MYNKKYTNPMEKVIKEFKERKQDLILGILPNNLKEIVSIDIKIFALQVIGIPEGHTGKYPNMDITFTNLIKYIIDNQEINEETESRILKSLFEAIVEDWNDVYFISYTYFSEYRNILRKFILRQNVTLNEIIDAYNHYNEQAKDVKFVLDSEEYDMYCKDRIELPKRNIDSFYNDKIEE